MNTRKIQWSQRKKKVPFDILYLSAPFTDEFIVLSDKRDIR